MSWSLQRSGRSKPSRLARYGIAATAVVGTATLAIAGGASANTHGAASGHQASSVYKVVLSNNFLGNDFRPEMERVAKLTAAQAPFKGKMSLQIVNAQSTPQAQISSLNTIIETRPNAILVDDGAGPALNPVIQRA